MAKAKFILAAIVLFATGLAQAKYNEQITASAILRVAAVNSPESLQTVFKGMARILEIVPIEVAPSGKEFTRCTQNVLAYTVPSISDGIYLCRTILTQSHNAIAQTLIHEAAHIVG